MPTHPDYVHQTLARAREEGQWYCGQPDAAALCFDVLALFPECEEAKDLVYELFCDEWTIYDNRVAIQQNIDEWDDRPWQQRRRQGTQYINEQKLRSGLVEVIIWEPDFSPNRLNSYQKAFL